MRLSEHSLSLDWLDQFDARDIHCAQLLLDALKLVSHTDFEASIGKVIQNIVDETSGLVALFTLDEKIIATESKPGSAGRLGHALTNLSRISPERILVQPSEAEMRDKRVQHIVLVEDFVGSGNRVKEFWNSWATKTLKSWLSYRVCRLWLAGYAIHEGGIAVASERITYLKSESIRFDIRLRSAELHWPRAILEFLERTATKTDLRIYPRGFGHIAAPIIFQHGCPDNCPVILWKSGKTFWPLFPNRGIPVAFNSCFQQAGDSSRGPELLRSVGQRRLALSLISEISQKKRSEEYMLLLILLGLLLRGVKPINLPLVMTIENSRINELLAKARELGLVDQTNLITMFGKDVVRRSRGAFLSQGKGDLEVSERRVNYIPRQFKGKICGVQ